MDEVIPTLFVSRKEWGALPPSSRIPIRRAVDYIVVHFDFKEVDRCLTREDCEETMRDLQRKHIRELGHGDQPYNFLVGDDGTIYEGRGWAAQPSSKLPLKRYNGNRLDIAYLGDYTDGDRMVLCAPIMDLIEHGVVLKRIKEDHAMKELPDLEKVEANASKPQFMM